MQPEYSLPETAEPLFLRNSDPLEPEDLPLQVALLTMELARLRKIILGEPDE
jgi:hypothetical protein